MDKTAALQARYLELEALHKRDSRRATIQAYLFIAAVVGALVTAGPLAKGLTAVAVAFGLAAVVAELSAHRHATAMDTAAMLRTLAAKE